MNFQQMRILRESAKLDYNLTDVGEALHTSQSGISKQIKELEIELGLDLYRRHGKRLLGLTDAGQEILDMAERILHDAYNIKQIAEQHKQQAQGRFIIATTHTQARYRLPAIVTEFKKEYPHVELYLHQGSPEEITQLLLRGEADIAIATESLNQHDALVTFDFYDWQHQVIAPKTHPLSIKQNKGKTVTLADVSACPIITYHDGFTGRGKIDALFATQNLKLDVVMAALDADVIKTYVDMGLGLGIVSSVALQNNSNEQWQVLNIKELSQNKNTTRIAIHHRHYIRGYIYHFLEKCIPTLNKQEIDNVIRHRYLKLQQAESAD